MKRQKVHLKAVKDILFLSIRIPEQWCMKWWLLIYRFAQAARLRINSKPDWLQEGKYLFPIKNSPSYKCAGLLHGDIITKKKLSQLHFLSSEMREICRIHINPQEKLVNSCTCVCWCVHTASAAGTGGSLTPASSAAAIFLLKADCRTPEDFNASLDDSKMFGTQPAFSAPEHL